jgi:ataxia telangiectasia mutated family protein
VGIREEAAGENTNISYDKRISRLISLWFDNRTNVKLTELMMAWLPKIPSYHFIPVLPQLAARLVSKLNPQLYHDEFPKLLQNLIEKCALEHPHQLVLFITFLIFLYTICLLTILFSCHQVRFLSS